METETVQPPRSSRITEPAPMEAETVQPLVRSGLEKAALEFVRGYVSGGLGLSVGFPLETVKIQQQNSPHSLRFMQGLRDVVGSRGILSLFDGVASPLVSYGFLIAINFSTYSAVSGYLERRFDPDSNSLRYALHGCAGLISGGVLSVFSSPFELVKIRLQSMAAVTVKEGRPAHYSSTWQLAKHVARTEGFRGFYRGHSLHVNALVLSLGSGVYFWVYNVIKGTTERRLNVESGQLSLPTSILIGGLTGIVYWTSIFGLDTVKTQIMKDTIEKTPRFRSVRHCLSTILKERNGKWSRLMFGPGISAALLRSFPVNAIMLGSYAYLGRKMNLD